MRTDECLTQWSRVLLEQMMVAVAVYKLPEPKVHYRIYNRPKSRPDEYSLYSPMGLILTYQLAQAYKMIPFLQIFRLQVCVRFSFPPCMSEFLCFSFLAFIFPPNKLTQ
jgi:hypothetical protein